MRALESLVLNVKARGTARDLAFDRVERQVPVGHVFGWREGASAV